MEEAASQASAGLDVREQKSQLGYTVKVAELNSGEHVTLSAMLASPGDTPTVHSFARGDGVVGILATGGTKPSEMGKTPFLVDLVTASMGLAFSFFAFTVVSERFRWLRRLIPPLSVMDLLETKDVVSYILDRCSLPGDSRLFRFSHTRVTYTGTADYLLGEASRAQPSEKGKYQAALICLATIGWAHDASKKNILRALNVLGVADVNQTLNDIGVDPDPHEWRETADIIAMKFGVIHQANTATVSQ